MQTRSNQTFPNPTQTYPVKQPVPTHALYIDDSGTKEYADDPAQYNDQRGKSRHFLYCGVLANLNAASILSSKIIELKEKYFNDSAVEVKSTWLRNPIDQKRRYLDPFGLSVVELLAFVDEYYELIQTADIKLIAAIINKPEMQEHYKNPFYPPAAAYDAILCRAQNDLTVHDRLAIIIDDTSGSTPKGNQYKKLLAQQHKILKQNGSKLWKNRGQRFPSVESLRFVNSAHSHLVQVADVCAYNVYRQFREHGPDWETPGPDGKLPMYEHFERIAGKFRCGPTGIVYGFGLIKLPEKNKVRWGI